MNSYRVMVLSITTVVGWVKRQKQCVYIYQYMSHEIMHSVCNGIGIFKILHKALTFFYHRYKIIDLFYCKRS